MNRTESIFRHPQRLAAAGVYLCLLAACQPVQQDVKQEIVPRADVAVQAAAQASSSVTQEKRNKASLQNILAIFSASNAPAWSAFDNVPGVQWNGSEPEDNPNAKPEYRRSRGGKLLLIGFDETDLPNGKVGVDAGSVRGNEGESGVTLNGDANQVNSIAVMKFYASQDYSGILKNQFGPGTAIELIAQACVGSEGGAPENRKFYRVAMPGTAAVYAEIYVDAEGGKYNPGSTTFEFNKSEPVDRIKSLGCEVVGKNRTQ